MIDGYRSVEGARLWAAKAVSGLLVFTLLIIHLVVNHLIVEGGLLSHADVVAYFSNPLVLTMEITFLILVVGHALLGVRGIILDLRPAAGTVRHIDLGLLLLGAISILYGIWLTLTVASMA